MQGTAGTTEEQIRYTWNYAMLIAHGPSHEALIKSPIFRAMEEGSIARFEEITRCASEVQDAMISLLSEKRISVPETGDRSGCHRGFSVIATSQHPRPRRQRHVGRSQAAVQHHRAADSQGLDTEIDIVRRRVKELSTSCSCELRFRVMKPSSRSSRSSRAAQRADAGWKGQAQDAVGSPLDC